MILCAAAFMATLDLFIVNVAFPDIGRSFHGASLSDLSWVLNAYAIVYAALLVPLGRLADRYGRKAFFIGGLALFTVGSAACAASPNLWGLVAFRVLQAAGAAALTPTSLGLLLNATPPEARARAVRIWAASGALAAAVGPVVGGLLVQAAWQWVFIVNVPVGLLAIVATLRSVPDSRDGAVTRVPDLVGAAVLAGAIGALALGLVKGPDWGWSSGRAVVSFAVAALAALVFAQRIRTHAAPVIEPALLRVRSFVWSNVTALAFSAAFGGSLLAVILWMQNVWHYSAVRTGFAIAPGPLLVPVFAAISDRLARRVPAGVIAAAGCTLSALGSVLVLLSVGPHAHYAAEILPGWLIGGAGVGLALPTIISSATAGLPPARTATGSAIVTMSRQIGIVLGISILVAVLGKPVGYANAHRAFQHGWWAIAGAALLGTFTAFGMSPRRRAAPSADPLPVMEPASVLATGAVR
ncbi:MAG: drug resistance transporter, EmrB/QacA subfamily [Acidimicrobiales bacterium]|nr:drug resistance transporter, EmrB/QacA subfamily [Acidimicrobiales bacterium]